MRRQANLSWCERHTVYLHKPRYYSLLHTEAIRYSLLLLGYKPAQHVTLLNTVGNCKTMVSIIILYYNVLGPPSYMRSVVDRNVVMRLINVQIFNKRRLCIQSMYLSRGLKEMTLCVNRLRGNFVQCLSGCWLHIILQRLGDILQVTRYEIWARDGYQLDMSLDMCTGAGRYIAGITGRVIWAGIVCVC